MDLSPYVAATGIVVILIILYAVTVSAEAIAKSRKAREEEVGGGQSIAAVILQAAAEGLLAGFLRGVFLIFLWFLLCYVLNGAGFGDWHPRNLVSGLPVVYRTPWPGLIALACCLISAAEGAIHAAEHGRSPYRWPFGSRARLRREAGRAKRERRATRKAGRKARGGEFE